MTVGIWPFWSQQDKIDQVFRLDTCGNAKQLAFLAKALAAKGVGSIAAVPNNGVGINPFTGYRYVSLPLNNPVQRVHWATDELWRFFKNCDVAVLNNEYMAIPLRAIFPRMRIIQMCPVPVDSGLFKYAFDAADLVVVRSPIARAEVQSYTRTPVSVWPMYYDAQLFAPHDHHRLIDVLFLPRCSANNATHHEEFLNAMLLEPWRVVFTDITRWLRMQYPTLTYSTPESYRKTVHDSKVVVSLYDSWNGEMGLYEALAAGCVPVVMRTPSNEQLFGHGYPFMISHTVNLRAAITAALEYKGGPVVPLDRVAHGSYQQAVTQAVEDVCRS